MKHEKSILNRAERAQSPLNGARLIFKWTVSRGRETYGLNICTLYVQTGWNNPEKVASCKGCGYDMPGACLAEYMQARFPDQLKKLPAGPDGASKYYGLSFYDKKAGKSRKHYRPGCKILLDGACGFSSMEKILYKIGFTLEYAGRYPGDRSNAQYILRAR